MQLKCNEIHADATASTNELTGDRPASRLHPVYSIYQFHCVGAKPQDTFLIKYIFIWIYFHLLLAVVSV